MRSGLHNIGSGFVSGKADTLQTIAEGFVRAADLGGASAVVPVDDIFVSSTANASTYTFSDVALTGSWTHLFLLPNGGSSIANQSVSSLTVEGNAAAHGVAAIDAGTGQNAEIWAIANATATPDVVVNWTGSRLNCGLGVIAVTGLVSLTPGDTDTAANADPLTGSVDVLAGGIVVGNVETSANGGSVWTGLTVFFDQQIESPYNPTGAYDAHASAATVNVSVDVPNNRECLALAAYR